MTIVEPRPLPHASQAAAAGNDGRAGFDAAVAAQAPGDPGSSDPTLMAFAPAATGVGGREALESAYSAPSAIRPASAPSPLIGAANGVSPGGLVFAGVTGQEFGAGAPLPFRAGAAGHAESHLRTRHDGGASQLAAVARGGEGYAHAGAAGTIGMRYDAENDMVRVFDPADPGGRFDADLKLPRLLREAMEKAQDAFDRVNAEKNKIWGDPKRVAQEEADRLAAENASAAVLFGDMTNARPAAFGLPTGLSVTPTETASKTPPTTGDADPAVMNGTTVRDVTDTLPGGQTPRDLLDTMNAMVGEAPPEGKEAGDPEYDAWAERNAGRMIPTAFDETGKAYRFSLSPLSNGDTHYLFQLEGHGDAGGEEPEHIHYSPRYVKVVNGDNPSYLYLAGEITDPRSRTQPVTVDGEDAIKGHVIEFPPHSVTEVIIPGGTVHGFSTPDETGTMYYSRHDNDGGDAAAGGVDVRTPDLLDVLSLNLDDASKGRIEYETFRLGENGPQRTRQRTP